MANNPFERVSKEFKRAAEKSAGRFKRELLRVRKQAQKVSDPEAAQKRAKAGMELAKAEFEAAMASARAEFKANLAGAQDELREMPPEEATRTLEYLKRARDELRAKRSAAPRGPRGWRQIRPAQEEVERLTEKLLKKPPKRRPPKRGLEGGEPAPVKPRPRPTPLAGAAEAPIE